MKKVILLMSLVVLGVACKKEIQKNTSLTQKYELNNDADQLQDRFFETVEDIAVEMESADRNALQWLHLAHLESPSANNANMAVADIKVANQYAYVLFKANNSSTSVIDVVDLSDEDIPLLVSSLRLNQAALSSMVVTETEVVAIGQTERKEKALYRIGLELGKLTTKVSLEAAPDLGSLSLKGQDIFLNSENGSWLVSADDLSSSKLSEQVELQNQKVVYKDHVIGLTPSSELAISKTTEKGSASESILPIKTQKFVEHSQYLLIADAYGQVNIVEGISPLEYNKCKGKKKGKKDKRDKKRKDRDDEKKKGDKKACEADVEVEFDGCSGLEIRSSKDLSNIVLDLAPEGPGSEDVKFDGLSGKFKAIDYSSDVVGVWVKSGCNQSGDCPGCGEYFSNDDCDGNDDDDDDDSGDDDDDDDNSYGCDCEGRMQSFSFFYDGPSGATIVAKDKKQSYVITTITNAQNGSTYLISGANSGNDHRLESQTYLGTSGGEFYNIHTSCSENIIDNVYGPFTIVGYTDGAGSTCETTNPPVTAQKLSECTVVGADPGYAFFQAVWLDDFFKDPTNGNLFDRGYRFEGGSGVFKELPDGRAVLYGEIYSPNYPNNRWDMTVYFKGKSTWAEWSAQGKTFKQGAGYIDGAHEDWTYYMMDETKSNVMVGLGDNAGFISNLTQRPSDGSMGFQIGEGGANDKNSAFGMAGWFFYEHPDGSIKKADWNLDVVNCVEQ